ncbi:MAG TPA: choice-of-anchor tandem repeat GloVer-containing protein [Terriglobia bacterium]|nr:choice-of-anchor tandem repeat GloVer-containing protein [Terriglobia bacterium]
MRNEKTAVVNEVGARATPATGWRGSFGIVCLQLCFIWAAMAVISLAQTRSTAPSYSVLYNFTGGADGANPYAGLVADGVGNLYGTTSAGGDLTGCSGYGCGVAFKLDPSGKETVLNTFSGGADGSSPEAGLIRGASANLYGTTFGGGAYGAGVVFKLDSSGNETVLYAFTGGADGANPQAGLVADEAGNFYGTTDWGGNLSACSGFGGCGTVFKLEASGTETALYTFNGGADGFAPYGGLVRDTAGNLYGTTAYGGAGCEFCGVVFQVTPSGNETVLYTFTGGADGSSPADEVLIRDRAGNLYGTTVSGGDLSGCGGSGCGVVFKLDRSGNETVLYAFTGGADGANPYTGLVGDGVGNFYGTTAFGGESDDGVVFKQDRSGKYSVLHTFNGADGVNPPGRLLLYKGSLYGTTYGGGTYGAGVVFKVHM